MDLRDIFEGELVYDDHSDGEAKRERDVSSDPIRK